MARIASSHVINGPIASRRGTSGLPGLTVPLTAVIAAACLIGPWPLAGLLAVIVAAIAWCAWLERHTEGPSLP